MAAKEACDGGGKAGSGVWASLSICMDAVLAPMITPGPLVLRRAGVT